MIKEFFEKRKFDLTSNRLGPDCPFTHWKLYFKTLMKKTCEEKFLHFGEGAEFRPGAYAISCNKISIGKNVIIRPQTMLFADPRDEENGSITIEDHVMVGSGVHIYVANHKFHNFDTPIIYQGHYNAKEVVLKEGCWVGANCTLLPGVTIGKNSVVGAGSVVTKSVADFTIVAGNPAKVIKEIES